MTTHMLMGLLQEGKAPTLHHIERQLRDSDWPVRDALHECLFADERQIRRNAAWLLRKFGDKSSVEWLIDSLQDKDAQVRQFAAMALGSLRDQRAVEHLSYMLDDYAVNVRLNVVRSLGQLEAHTAISLLLIILKNNREDSEVQAMAARVLGDLQAREAINTLYNSLNHKAHSVHTEAAMALAKIGVEALPKLLNGLQDDKKNYRRRKQAAATAIGWMIGRGAVDGNHDALTVAIEGLIAEAGSHDVSVRVEIAQALGTTNDIRAIEPLTIGLLYDVPAVRRSAAKAIKELAEAGKIKMVGVIEALTDALNDKDRDVVFNAIEALGFVHEGNAIPTLLELTQHDDMEIRYKAIQALGDTQNEEVVKPVARLLRERDVWTRRCAAMALGKLGHGRAVKALVHTLSSDSEPIVRQWAALGLARIGDDSVIPHLRGHLDADTRVQTAVDAAIVELGG